MHVAICIVGFRNAAEVAACVNALGGITHRDFELIICENGGPEAYRQLKAALPASLDGRRVDAVEAPENLGYAGGINFCIRARAEADAWWVLNPDTVPDAHALERLVERLSRGDCGAVGGTLHDSHCKVQSYGGRWRPLLARAESIGRGSRLDKTIDPKSIEERTNYVSGACMLVGRRLVDAIGLMREDYFLYCEEIEWCLRAQARGLRFGLAPEALVLHNQGGTTGSAHDVKSRPRLPIYLDERNKLNVIRDTRPVALVIAAPAAFLLIALRFARRGAWKQWRYALAGWRAGLRNERGKPAWVV